MATFINICLRRATFPAVWGQAIQSMIPKSEDDLSIRNWKPLSLISIIVRCLTTTITRRETFKTWAHTWRGDFSYGGFTNIGVHDAIHELDSAWSDTRDAPAILVSLDMGKAFDKCRTDLVVRILVYLGLDVKLSNLLRHVWSHVRFLRLAGQLRPEGIEVHALPQGEAMRVFGMAGHLLA